MPLRFAKRLASLDFDDRQGRGLARFIGCNGDDCLVTTRFPVAVGYPVCYIGTTGVAHLARIAGRDRLLKRHVFNATLVHGQNRCQIKASLIRKAFNGLARDFF